MKKIVYIAAAAAFGILIGGGALRKAETCSRKTVDSLYLF